MLTPNPPFSHRLLWASQANVATGTYAIRVKGELQNFSSSFKMITWVMAYLKRHRKSQRDTDTRAASHQSKHTDGSEQTASNIERFPPLVNSISVSHAHHFPLLCLSECLHLLSGQFFWAPGVWCVHTTWRWESRMGGGVEFSFTGMHQRILQQLLCPGILFQHRNGSWISCRIHCKIVRSDQILPILRHSVDICIVFNNLCAFIKQ